MASTLTHRFAVVTGLAPAVRHNTVCASEAATRNKSRMADLSNVLGYAEHADMPLCGNRGTPVPTVLCESVGLRADGKKFHITNDRHPAWQGVDLFV